MCFTLKPIKYSKSDKNLKVFPPMLDERSRFCVCSFMQKIFVIGGNINYKPINSCMAYDIKTNKWTYIASMNKERGDTSSAVFQGKVVVTGGYIDRRFSSGFLKSVEAYCFHENKWTQLPDMLKERSEHSTVSIENKMFVIDFNDLEVFDCITNKFTIMKSNLNTKNIFYLFSKICVIVIGYKIHVFKVIYSEEKERFSTFCYDVIQEFWTSEVNFNPKCCSYFSCEKMFKH